MICFFPPLLSSPLALICGTSAKALGDRYLKIGDGLFSGADIPEVSFIKYNLMGLTDKVGTKWMNKSLKQQRGRRKTSDIYEQ